MFRRATQKHNYSEDTIRFKHHLGYQRLKFETHSEVSVKAQNNCQRTSSADRAKESIESQLKHSIFSNWQ